MKPILARLLSLCALWLSPAAAATIDFEFDSSLIYAYDGETVTFTGSVTNLGAGPAYIAGPSVTFPLPFDDLPFFFTVPAVLDPGGSVSGPLLEVAVPLGTALGLYVGTMSILGGDTPAALDLLATETFGVQVIPEPATVALLSASLLLLLAGRLRRSA